MTLTLTVKLTDEQAGAILAMSNSASHLPEGMPYWAYHEVSLYGGYDFSYKLSSLGKQAKEQLKNAVKK